MEEKYEGPRLEEEISADFMQEMMDWLRNQKLLHKKYAFKVSQKVSDQKIYSAYCRLIGQYEAIV